MTHRQRIPDFSIMLADFTLAVLGAQLDETIAAAGRIGQEQKHDGAAVSFKVYKVDDPAAAYLAGPLDAFARELHETQQALAKAFSTRTGTKPPYMPEYGLLMIFDSRQAGRDL